MTWQGKRVLITGVGGFAGSYLAKALIDAGAEVYGLVKRRADGTLPKNLVDRGVAGGVKLIEGDLRDITSLAMAIDRAQPDVIFHLAAQSFVPRSFTHPLETLEINTIGTANLLEAVRMRDKTNPVIVFAGSSEEYGLVISSERQYKRALEKYGAVYPPPAKIPELPIAETNPLRPMSPYAASKVHGDYLMRTYHAVYGLRTIVSRAFNHEGAGRGIMFVTAQVACQVMKLKMGETDRIKIGNVNAFRDWSHVEDIVAGYMLLAERGTPGEVYNQGSMRTNSVLTYILIALEEAGWKVRRIEALAGGKKVDDPTQPDESPAFGIRFWKTKVDRLMLDEQLEYEPQDKGIAVETDRGRITVEFDQARFRPAEVPILLADTRKIQDLGFRTTKTLRDIARDQLNYYLKQENRHC
ncbi:GDP-mannose 4,6-dehydratase [Pyrobaculum neutrophilum]|uniref:NAD-dependent epimerase/dehydratase n=1 Tax=Pyrobaculum neutrophilum (strain DSM 2338 / JCM 9278 / NBRC 100436 / V24Sta) TaxID=444157 RepID=B1YCC5_PYRNV|nr:GDP-mannose 4,6-dehydratase [Pyrobaculum neutrophilum]ACB39438.1 NAD-dependent epimerase/dehydratase [Pyrobaculum neutrophilum V24Sta]